MGEFRLPGSTDPARWSRDAALILQGLYLGDAEEPMARIQETRLKRNIDPSAQSVQNRGLSLWTCQKYFNP